MIPGFDSQAGSAQFGDEALLQQGQTFDTSTTSQHKRLPVPTAGKAQHTIERCGKHIPLNTCRSLAGLCYQALRNTRIITQAQQRYVKSARYYRAASQTVLFGHGSPALIDAADNGCIGEHSEKNSGGQLRLKTWQEYLLAHQASSEKLSSD
jgi:hypothetical protein